MQPRILFIAGTLALFSGSQLAHAQRERPTRDDRQATRQQQMATMTPEQRQQYFQQRWEERYQNATPEQKARMDAMRQQMNDKMQAAGIDPNDPNAMQKAMAAGVDLGFGGQGGQGRGGRGGNNPQNAAKNEQRRAIMIAAGITDRPTQDAILNFMNQQEQSRTNVLRLAKAAARALVTPQARTVADGAPVEAPVDPEAQLNRISDTYEAYNQAIQEDRARYGQALQQLNDQIHFMDNPRLHSFMVLAGILEYDALSLGGVPAIFPQEVLGTGNANGGGAVVQTSAAVNGTATAAPPAATEAADTAPAPARGGFDTPNPVAVPAAAPPAAN